jgi:coenzyme PQQ precursor peptide PqqA
MNWETPSFEEIAMSAEIGSYQEDFGDEEYRGL